MNETLSRNVGNAHRVILKHNGVIVVVRVAAIGTLVIVSVNTIRRIDRSRFEFINPDGTFPPSYGNFLQSDRLPVR